MLGIFRRNKNNPVVLFMLGLVALLMVGFGVSFQGLEQTGYAARVNGEIISESDFVARYTPEYDQRQQLDSTYDRRRAESDGLREQVLDRMITEKLLAQKARQWGLAVDDEALRDQILSIPDFKVNGRFDREQYQRVLRATGRSERIFEENLREQLLADKMLAALQGVSVSERELREAFERRETQVEIEYVEVKSSQFTPDIGTVTAADVEAWAADVEDVDQVVKDFYRKNKDSRYDVPKKACARHILVRVDDSTPKTTAADKKDKIAEAAEKLKAGADFQEVATEYSEDANRSQGGSLGCFTYEDALQPVAEAAFGLQPGEISPIVKSGFGYHVVKLDRFEEPIRIKREDAEEDIKRELTAQARTRSQARELAAQVLATASATTSLSSTLSAVETDVELEAKTVGPFPVDRKYFQGLGYQPELSQAAFALTEDAPVAEDPYETEDGFLVLRLKSRKEADPSEFEGRRSNLENMQVTTKLNQVYPDWQKALQEGARIDINPRVLNYGS